MNHKNEKAYSKRRKTKNEEKAEAHRRPENTTKIVYSVKLNFKLGNIFERNYLNFLLKEPKIIFLVG